MAVLKPISQVEVDVSLAAGRLPCDIGGAAVTATGPVYASGPVTSPFTNAPAAHTAADAQLSAVSAKRNSVVSIVASVSGTGTAPTGTLLSLVEDLAGANTTLWSVALVGFGTFILPFPGGMQQPTANKTLDIILADPGASNTGKVSGSYFNS